MKEEILEEEEGDWKEEFGYEDLDEEND